MRITHYCLQLLAELALSLRDDLRPHVPELLPRFVGLFVEAERSGVFDMVRPALSALEVSLGLGWAGGSYRCVRLGGSGVWSYGLGSSFPDMQRLSRLSITHGATTPLTT